jgi:diketogulonate reductase-like aldo/keto reductase
MKSVALPCGERVPALGLGTWNMGDDAAHRREELAALRRGLDLGATLIDTAEMYGDGRAEELVAEAIAGRRDETFIVSKVYPHNATRRGLPLACERSLQRLRTDRIDLYLLHWRGNVPLAETLAALQDLQRAGKIRHYGVSNLDCADLEEWLALPGGDGVQTDQVLYNLMRRGIEWDLQPWLRRHRLPVMAYSPLEQARLLEYREFATLAQGVGATPAQVALAWLLRHDDVVVIPKSSSPGRVEENVGAADIALSAAQLAALDAVFPPPTKATPLDML